MSQVWRIAYFRQKWSLYLIGTSVKCSKWYCSRSCFSEKTLKCRKNAVQTTDRANFQQWLPVVLTRSALFEFVLVFYYSKNFKFAYCLKGFDIWNSLDLQKYAIFCPNGTYDLPFWNIPWWITKGTSKSIDEKN